MEKVGEGEDIINYQRFERREGKKEMFFILNIKWKYTETNIFSI